MLKIAILGTRGVPNHYGGFEQFAEFFSVFLKEQGHDVYVYNSHNHPHQEPTFRGVKILHKFDPEYLLGTFGQFIYDFNCIRDSRKRKFDVILQLGYTSSSIWGWMLPKKSVIISNMDGLEWKRTKYSPPVQKFLKYAEKLAVKTSDYLVSDSIGIQDYLKEEYGADSEFIAYGAETFKDADENVLAEYGVEPYGYSMLIARMEPENNIEVILDGVELAGNEEKFLVIGNYKSTKFGNYLLKKFSDSKKIQFLGGVYNLQHLNNLRYYSNLYFHGHSVGGTNPSLLEAMASKALIVAHDNPFNKSILQGEAFYFSNKDEVKDHLQTHIKSDFSTYLDSNFDKIEKSYNWPTINHNYLSYCQRCVELDKNEG
ncbi:DUF1972 domain-containing protein [Flagellimonas sp. DF-77]|uniref:DUF1972 domain-containing protein n=1 Tax=Flagellimonas algarum TaxID=3230298 RepID=UPI00339A86E8